MYKYIVAALAAVIAGCILAFKNKEDIQAMSLKLSAALSLAISILVLPYHLLDSDLPIAIIQAIRSGISGIAMGADGEIPYKLGLEPVPFQIYRFILYSLYVIGPLVGSLFLFSFSSRLRILGSFLGKKRFAVFSELNERSLAIGESLAKKNKDVRLIYCGVDRSRRDMLDRTAAISALTVSFPITGIRLFRKGNYEFFAVEQDDEKRLLQASVLAEKLLKQKNYDSSRVILRIFAGPRQQELLHDLDQRFAGKIYLRHIDEDNALAISILEDNSDLLAIRKDLKVTVLADDPLAEVLIKDLVWLLIKPEGQFRIRLAGPKAADLYARIAAAAPDISFYPIEVLEEKYGQEGRAVGNDDDLIFVIYENDEQAFETASRIRRQLSSRNKDLHHARICCRIKDGDLKQMIQAPGITLFGDSKESLSYEKLVSPVLEEAAKRVHLSYLSLSAADLSDREKLLEESGFYRYQNQSSSFAQALALTYKRRYILSFKEDDELSDTRFIADWLKDEQHLQLMAEAEHERWNAYQRIQGWRKADEEQTEAIIRKHAGTRANDPDLKLHPALVDNEELPQVEKTVNELLAEYGSDHRVHYLEADKVMLRKMNYILTGEEDA